MRLDHVPRGGARADAGQGRVPLRPVQLLAAPLLARGADLQGPVGGHAGADPGEGGMALHEVLLVDRRCCHRARQRGREQQSQGDRGRHQAALGQVQSHGCSPSKGSSGGAAASVAAAASRRAVASPVLTRWLARL